MRFGFLLIALFSSLATLAADVSPRSILYTCHSREALARAKELTRAVMNEAATEFGRINPAVRDRFVSRLRSRKLQISCGNASQLDRNDAQAYSQGRTFKSYKISVRADDLLNLPDTDMKHILLHEMLHYAKIDNISTRRHNEIYGTNPYADYVYSCAYAVYPTPMYPMDYSSALKTCETATFKR